MTKLHSLSPKKTEAEKTEKKLWQHNYCLLMRFAAAGLSPQQKGYSSRQLFQPFVTDILFFREANCRLICFLPSLPLPVKLGLLLSAGFKAFPRFCFGWALYISPSLVVGKKEILILFMARIICVVYSSRSLFTRIFILFWKMPVGTCVVGPPCMPPLLMNKFIHVDRLRLRRSAKWEKGKYYGK